MRGVIPSFVSSLIICLMVVVVVVVVVVGWRKSVGDFISIILVGRRRI